MVSPSPARGTSTMYTLTSPVRRHPCSACFSGIVASQELLALGGGTLTNTEEIAIMAAAGLYFAVVLAFKAFSVDLGGAVRSAVSGAVSTNLLPPYLEENLPNAEKSKAKAIFANLKTQLSYQVSSSERDAIVQAYVDFQ